ncbi:MAG: DNA repair protein RecO [Bacillota bacterium]
MSLYKTEGIVLRARNLGEADKSLTIYTREEGKVQAAASGARRSRSPLAAATQPYTHGFMLCFRGRGLDRLSQFEIREPFAGLREDLAKSAYATYFAELTDEFTRERDRNPDLFLLLLAAQHMLQAGSDPEVTARLYELRLLSLAGLRPELSRCAGCGKAVSPAEGRADGGRAEGGWNLGGFSVAAGGVLCPDCAGKDETAISVPPGAIESARFLLTADLRKAAALKLAAPVARALEDTLSAYILYHLEKPLKSLNFLREVR